MKAACNPSKIIYGLNINFPFLTISINVKIRFPVLSDFLSQSKRVSKFGELSEKTFSDK